MSLSQLLNDEIIIRKRDGSTNGPYKCSVDGEEILIMQASVDVAVGDSAERKLPNEKVESFAVLDVEFVRGLGSIPDSWTLHVRKDGSKRPDGHKTTNIHIANANAIQIGDHNLQQVSSVIQSLIHEIDQSDANQEQKKEAKSKLLEYLQHPAVTATLGATASALVKSILGG